MTNEKTTRELVYETNRDVKWICRALQRMEAQDEEFESRIRALEGWRKFTPEIQARIRPALEKVAATEGISPDVAEIVGKALG